jgi:hypothetical protein
VQVSVSVKTFVFVTVVGEAIGTEELIEEDTLLEETTGVLELRLADSVEEVVQLVDVVVGVTTTTVEVETAGLGITELLWVSVQGQLVIVSVVASVIVYVTPLWVS